MVNPKKKIDAVKFTDCFLDILEIKDPTGYGRKIMFVKLPTKIGMSFLFRYAEESASVITKKEFKTFQKHATKQYVKSFIFPTFNANCSISTKEQKNREKFSAYLIKHQNQVIKADYITPDNIMVKEKGLKINIHSLFSVAPMGTMKNIDYLFGRSYLIGGNL